MNESDAAELVRNAIWTIILVGGPFVISTMLVGTLIAVMQALTQIQEMTLTFVPKVVAVIIVIIAASNFLATQLNAFSLALYERIQNGFE